MIDFNKGLINRGNTYRINKAFEKALSGKETTLAFIGGSITQGCAASKNENSYVYKVYDWWCKEFKKSTHKYINAGIGATTSLYGVSRVEEDVLKYNPDVVFIEFSVNDADDIYFQESYEGLVRRVLYHQSKPAVILIHNIEYDNAFTAQRVHLEIGKYYDIPCVSMIATVYDAIKNGRININKVTDDGLHPNDSGHELVSQVITNSLCQLRDNDFAGNNDTENLSVCENVLNSYTQLNSLAQLNPYTQNRYEKLNLYDNSYNKLTLDGFIKGERLKENYLDIFTHGWIGKNVGDKMEFSVNASCIALAYRRTVNKPAPVAKVYLDDIEAAILDGNFDEDWGDKLCIQLVLVDNVVALHKVKIEIIEATEEDKSDFYISSIMF